MRHSARELLGGEMAEAYGERDAEARRAGWVRWAALVLLIAAVAMALFGGKAAGVFFGAGALLLIAGLLLGFAGSCAQAAIGSGLLSLRQLGVRNAGAAARAQPRDHRRAGERRLHGRGGRFLPPRAR